VRGGSQGAAPRKSSRPTKPDPFGPFIFDTGRGCAFVHTNHVRGRLRTESRHPSSWTNFRADRRRWDRCMRFHWVGTLLLLAALRICLCGHRPLAEFCQSTHRVRSALQHRRPPIRLAPHPLGPQPTPHPNRPITPSNERATPLGAAVDESVRRFKVARRRLDLRSDGGRHS
jgi:hypothetical protein